RGIRPALGYPASPDHSLKKDLFDLLKAQEIGLDLTTSYAMTPAASVSGLIFAHPASRYFTVGRVGRDQIEDAYELWQALGEPGRARFGITVTPDQQELWLDEADSPYRWDLAG
ncbi:vitamin B12 dependent-methionine synthase activation domain-containing protein, partial [Kibdelosporangium lantanae]